MAVVTIFTGSMLAYKEKKLKRRLACSSFSQVSYVLLLSLIHIFTLTPGTITVDVKDDVLWVHALTAEMAEGLKDWHVARQLARIEEVR